MLKQFKKGPIIPELPKHKILLDQYVALKILFTASVHGKLALCIVPLADILKPYFDRKHVLVPQAFFFFFTIFLPNVEERYYM